MIYNLTVEGFNTAIDNRDGYCVLNNVALNNNRMDYIIDRDDGAAILNGGLSSATTAVLPTTMQKMEVQYLARDY